MLPAGHLARALDVSRPTLARRFQEERADILRIGLGRRTRYGLVRSWEGLQTARFPVLRIDASGEVRSAGELVTLAARQTVWLPAGEVFEGLPIEIADASPAGFLGQLFARRHANIGIPGRTTDWSGHHVLLAATRRGEDLPGNLIVGQESLDRWFGERPRAVTIEDFPELADAASTGQPTGSLAGGDRPKFGAYADGRHVLVKFAAQADSAAAVRWRDLLALEALALDVLREHGVPAAQAQLLSSDSYRFLEVERFDRIGERGRRPVMTLAAVHQNPIDSWSAAADRLLEMRWLSLEDARRLRLLDAFGALIGNTDRHHRNVAFFPAPAGPDTPKASRFALAPAFDQLPMFYAPGADGSVPVREFIRPAPSASALDVWDEARSMALDFWRHASDADAVSEDMRRIAGDNARRL